MKKEARCKSSMHFPFLLSVSLYKLLQRSAYVADVKLNVPALAMSCYNKSINVNDR